MLLYASLCAVLATTAFAGSTPNVFMDDLLKEMEVQTRSTGLDPSIVESFAIKVKAKGLTNRDFKANFTRGSLYGLGQLKRHGNCSYGFAKSDLKMGCYLSLGSLRFLMNATVKGDQISGSPHNITTSSQVSAETFLLVELQGSRNSSVKLSSMKLSPVTMTTTVTRGKVNLNGGRFIEFAKQTNNNLVQELNAILAERYSQVLHSVANRHRMP